MGDSYFLQQSKEIYSTLKETHLAETRRRAEGFLTQVINPDDLNADFKVAVSDMRYRMSHYKRLLDAEENILNNSPWEVRGKMEKELLKIYGDRLVADVTRYAEAVDKACQGLTPEQHFIYKTYFQEQLIEFITFSSAFSHRAIMKPNGYAGDFKMMEMLCDDNVYVGKTLFEKCCHRFSVTSPSGAPVKNRLKVIYDTLEKTLKEVLVKKDNPRMLDLACGPSIPVQKFLMQEESSKIEFFLLDQDANALEQLQRRLRDLKETYKRSSRFHFFNQPIQQLLSDPKTLEALENQDLIVSSGLFDYLDDSLAAMLMNVLHMLLADGGTLLIGNLCPAETTKIFQWYVNEWPLNFRTKEELLALAPEGTKPEILSEELGYNLFLKIKK